MKHNLYKPLGFLFLLLGLLGIPLPILPSTPFILLAAWFFARSSEKWHQWLLNSQLFGPMISDWENRRCITCRTKVVATAAMIVAGGASVGFALEEPTLKLLALLLLLIGSATVLSIKTCPQS